MPGPHENGATFPHQRYFYMESSRKDLAGQRFGKLTAIRPTAERSQEGCILWTCKCDCGRLWRVKSRHLITREVTSCGCKIGRWAIEA